MTRRSSSAIPVEFSYRLLSSTAKEPNKLLALKPSQPMERTGDSLGPDQDARCRPRDKCPPNRQGALWKKAYCWPWSISAIGNRSRRKPWQTLAKNGAWGVRDDIPMKRCRRSRNSHHGTDSLQFQRSADRMLKSIRKFSLTRIETYCARFDSIFCLVTSSGVNIGCAKCSLGFCRRR
jgi:hypothetical protein